MCGIVAVLPRLTWSQPESPSEIESFVLGTLSRAVDAGDDLERLALELGQVNDKLRHDYVIASLLGRNELLVRIEALLAAIDANTTHYDRDLEEIDRSHVAAADRAQEVVAKLSPVRDLLWSIRNDRLRTIRSVFDFCGVGASTSAAAAFISIQQVLSSLDRLEVRGRDSAGVHLMVHHAKVSATDSRVIALAEKRLSDPLFANHAVRCVDGVWSFVYKAAAEIGELGDNTRAIRQAITNDDLLRLVLADEDVYTEVLAHTRWASVGIISEPNAHPVNNEQIAITASPYVAAALNGDVDNYVDLKVEHGLRFADPITTDAKVIPVLVSQTLTKTNDPSEAFRQSVVQFEGSIAIAAAIATDPGKLHLALAGSGQGLYVGVCSDRWIVASEPYGVVEETDTYFALQGEAGGEVVVLDARKVGEVAGIVRRGYDGVATPVTESDLARTEITTRDIDRGEYRHFLLKEISESPRSFRATLRGRIGESKSHLVAAIGTQAMPAHLAKQLAKGKINRITVIGQGTAAVAGRAVAQLLSHLVGANFQVDAMPATELSGFGLEQDMSDTIVIAVSQSGTTTDTNRTVDLVRARGGNVLAIVNRRGSDLAQRADGVLYTSDGRDVEMSVASTKAFYAQVAAGALYACAIAQHSGCASESEIHNLLTSLTELPDAMNATLELRPQIAEIAQRHATRHRYWAIVGNGPNYVAALEVRIKLSELCYKSISADVTEDKKHIDLSSEPMIFVCAAGLSGSTADDVAKEVSIYKAHKATPIVVASDGDRRFDNASAVINVPSVHPALGFILSAMVGHLFGYEAALAIDASARPLREAREVIERLVQFGGDAQVVMQSVHNKIANSARMFSESLRAGNYDGHLEASTAVQLANMFRYALSDQPLDAYQNETGKVSSPSALLDDLVQSLTRAVDELTRPIDAIKHQAKTVTVGISRSDEGVMDRALIQEVLATGLNRDRITFRTMRVLAALDLGVDEVTGFTRYEIEGEPTPGNATIRIIDRGGISLDLPSRVDKQPVLVGTKRRVAAEREVLVSIGGADSRTVILIPEVKGSITTGITLVHVKLHDFIAPANARAMLQGYDRRYDRLVDWVSETEGGFNEDRLAEISVVEMLTSPISEVAKHWRAR